MIITTMPSLVFLLNQILDFVLPLTSDIFHIHNSKDAYAVKNLISDIWKDLFDDFMDS